MVELNLVEQKHISQNSTDSKPALGVIDALAAGFEAVLRRPWLLLIPLALDLFLWMGPRLHAEALYQQFDPTLRDMSQQVTSADMRLALQDLGQLLREFFAQYNLFSALSVSLIGVPVINAGIRPDLGIFGGAPWVWQLSSLDGYFLFIILASVVGLLFSAAFWTILGSFVRGQPFRARQWMEESLNAWKQFLLLGLTFVALVLLSILPVSMIMLTISMISVALASLVPMLAMVVFAWLVLVGIFIPHGVVIYHVSLSQALRISAMVVRLNFAPTLGLLAIIIAVSIGTGLIWDGLPFDSMLRLVAMLGNAIIGTGLLIASLMYYQNRSAIMFAKFHWPIPGQPKKPIARDSLEE